MTSATTPSTHSLPSDIPGFLSRVPVPFWLAPQSRPSGGFEYVERGSRSIARALYLAAGCLFLIGSFTCIAGMTGLQLGATAGGAYVAMLGGMVAFFGFGQSLTARTLRYDPRADRLRLSRTRSQRPVNAIQAPRSQCDVAIHPIHCHASRGPDWDGFAVVLHLREGPTRGHFTIGAFKSEPMAAACVARLPEPLKSVYRGQGPKLNVGLFVRVPSLAAFRASRSRCPKCGYDLSSILDDAGRCPECGWHRETA